MGRKVCYHQEFSGLRKPLAKLGNNCPSPFGRHRVQSGIHRNGLLDKWRSFQQSVNEKIINCFPSILSICLTDPAVYVATMTFLSNCPPWLASRLPGDSPQRPHVEKAVFCWTLPHHTPKLSHQNGWVAPNSGLNWIDVRAIGSDKNTWALAQLTATKINAIQSFIVSVQWLNDSETVKCFAFLFFSEVVSIFNVIVN